MKFTVTIEEATLEDMKGLFGEEKAAQIVQAAAKEEQKPAEQDKKQKVAKPTKREEKVKEEPVKVAEEPTEEAPAEVKEEPAKQKHTIEEVKQLLIVKKKAGKDIAVVIKEQLKLNKLSELPEDRIDEAYKFADEL